MESFSAILVVFGILLLFLSTGVWIFIALFSASIIVLASVLGYPLDRIGAIATRIVLKSSSGWELSAIPMFILMGEIIMRTDIVTRLFAGIAPLVRWLPGGLIHTNVAGCTVFAAISGSSPGTTFAVGKITLKQLEKRGYDKALSLGSLAGAGSFGLLIPPSVSMIIYGLQAEVSITQLFMAGLLPGLMMAGLYSLYIGGACLIRPSKAPERGSFPSFPEILHSLWLLAPMLVIIGIIMGAIYSGLATPSEAAAVSVLVSLLIVAGFRQLNPRLIVAALKGTLEVSSMILMLVVAASLLSSAMGYLHMPQRVGDLVAGIDPTPFQLLLILMVFYIIMGMFLDGISLILMSLPLTLPLVLAAGFDPIWFGVFLVVMVELGTMTPPVGINLFVITSLTKVPSHKVAIYAFPFFLMMCAGVFLLIAFPQIALWLPRAM